MWTRAAPRPTSTWSRPCSACRRDRPGQKPRLELACSTYHRLCQIMGKTNIFLYTYCSYKSIYFAKLLGTPELVRGRFEARPQLRDVLVRLGRHALRATGPEDRGIVPSDPSSRQRRGLTSGCAHYFRGRLDEAEADMLQAVGPLDKVGDWFGVFSHHILRHIYLVRGDIPRELAEAEREIAIGTDRGDDETLAWGYYGKADALARAGQAREAIPLATRAVELLPMRSTSMAIALGVLGFVRLQASDYARLATALERARSTAFRAICAFEFVGPTFPLLVESLLGSRWADAEADGGPSRTVAAKAWRESRFARFIGWRYPNYWPHALRVSGRAAFALGKTRQAARYLERSIAAAEELGARYDLARARSTPRS